MGYALKVSNVDFSSVALDKVTYGESIPCTGIEFDVDTLTFEKVGDTYQLEPILTPANTTDSVTWESSNESLASVSGGVVTIHGIGTATITATCGNYSATASINQTTIKPQYNFKVVNDRTCGGNTVPGSEKKLLGSEYSSGMSIGGQPYHNDDDLRIRYGDSYDVECVRVPYGATKVKIVTTGSAVNYIEVVDTDSKVTASDLIYPEWVKNQDWPFYPGYYAVEYGQAFALRGNTERIGAVSYLYFE